MFEHIIEDCKRAWSYKAQKYIPAHQRHTLTDGTVTAHGCESLQAAARLMTVRVYGFQR